MNAHTQTRTHSDRVALAKLLAARLQAALCAVDNVGVTPANKMQRVAIYHGQMDCNGHPPAQQLQLPNAGPHAVDQPTSDTLSPQARASLNFRLQGVRLLLADQACLPGGLCHPSVRFAAWIGVPSYVAGAEHFASPCRAACDNGALCRTVL